MTSSSFQGGAAPQRNEKVEQILAGARQVFLEHGFGAATTDMVQRAAGVSKSTVYAHFPSKDALFVAVIGAECQKLVDRTRAERLMGKTVRETLTRIGTNLLQTALSPPVIALYRIIVAEAARVPEIGAALSDAGPKHMQHEVAAYLTEADRRGEIRVSDPGAAASDFQALALHDIQQRCLLGISAPPKASQIRKIVDAAVDVFLRAYASR
jgi:TetR/AcrR family transcriptional regulator, mexJK operon transcriptional repressor